MVGSLFTEAESYFAALRQVRDVATAIVSDNFAPKDTTEAFR